MSVPTVDEVRAFLHRQIAEAKRMDDTDRLDDLLEKLADVDGLQKFIEQVSTDRGNAR